jgi:hypothetical protein
MVTAVQVNPPQRAMQIGRQLSRKHSSNAPAPFPVSPVPAADGRECGGEQQMIDVPTVFVAFAPQGGAAQVQLKPSKIIVQRQEVVAGSAVQRAEEFMQWNGGLHDQLRVI